MMDAAERAAVAEEREACAKLAESTCVDRNDVSCEAADPAVLNAATRAATSAIAGAIRRRGEPDDGVGRGDGRTVLFDHDPTAQEVLDAAVAGAGPKQKGRTLFVTHGDITVQWGAQSFRAKSGDRFRLVGDELERIEADLQPTEVKEVPE